MTDRLGPDAAPRGTNLAYIAGLDGIRGVGMLNIMGVHAGVWLTGGGFYLLDSFFALSGFLITTLLITEWRKRSTIRLRTFWARRARRLLPALFLMLLGVAFIFGILVPAGTYPGLRGDALSSLFYFANWHFILSSSNYFDQTSLTSPLIHMWSLALEEQFYLVWPLVVLGVLKVFRSLWALLAVSVVGAIASALEMALLYKPGNTTRLYFGTDTHAQSVLVGATLAVALAIWSERRGNRDWAARTRSGRWALTAIGALGIAVSAFLYASVKSTDSIAYRGGFLLAAVAASAVLLSVSCAQESPVSKLFCFPLFTFIGRISYGMYLWHFPLFTYINHARTGLSGWALFGVRFVPTLLIATASFYLVERPIRTGKLFTAWRSWTFTPVALVAVVVAVLLATEAPACQRHRKRVGQWSAGGYADPDGRTGHLPQRAGPGAPGRRLGSAHPRFRVERGDTVQLEPVPHDAPGPRDRGVRSGRRCDFHQGGRGRPVGGLAVLPRPRPGQLPTGRCLRSRSERALSGLDISLGGLGETTESQCGRPVGWGSRGPRPVVRRNHHQHSQPGLRRLREEPAGEGGTDCHRQWCAHGAHVQAMSEHRGATRRQPVAGGLGGPAGRLQLAAPPGGSEEQRQGLPSGLEQFRLSRWPVLGDPPRRAGAKSRRCALRIRANRNRR